MWLIIHWPCFYILFSFRYDHQQIWLGVNSSIQIFMFSMILQFVFLFVFLPFYVVFRVLCWIYNLFGCVSVCLPWFSLFASGLGMKGPGGLVREERADVSWPVGTWFSHIKLPSQAGFGLTLTRSHSVFCLFPIPLLSLITPLSLSATGWLYVDLCPGNALEPIHHSFEIFLTNYCWCNSQYFWTVTHKTTD